MILKLRNKNSKWLEVQGVTELHLLSLFYSSFILLKSESSLWKEKKNIYIYIFTFTDCTVGSDHKAFLL